MASYVSINTSPAAIRSAGGRLTDLGSGFRDAGSWADIGALEEFGDDKFGAAMREQYPASTWPIWDNKMSVGQSLVDTGQDCMTAMDLYEQQEGQNAANISSIDPRLG
ncbi:hypothetical protein DI005_23515 [Prauserella sp. PE36]|uniref:hypothetical protein n=1 Tax=Prauserella sp. PE36 TaxID=1504709 RepID=UPI000D9C36A3|nr:hypothetical protein [Prauserella sp. PE36]PXY28925.1 hypothetical protein BAY59_14800 [Prauserella coralliicola]RBM17251.1 hypothetical protein DI005_23515 [Prauserella sp. PE36]